MGTDQLGPGGAVHTKSTVSALALRALEGRLSARVLRGLEDRSRTEGDIDLIVAPGRAREACAIVAAAALRHGWYLLWFRDLYYVCSVALLMPGEGGRDQVCKLDFQNGFSWHAVPGDRNITDPFADRWRNLHSNWSDRRVVGALTFLQKLMAAGTVSESEWIRIGHSGADSDYVATIAHGLNLPLTRSDIERRRIGLLQKWVLRAASAGASGAIGRVVWLLAACAAYVKCKSGFWLDSGLALGISGLDGSGKSTLAERLMRCYAQADIRMPTAVHLLPAWLPMPHQLFRRKKTSNSYDKPYSEPPVKSKVSASIRLCYYVLAFLVTRLATTFSSVRGQVIVFDRSVLDFAADLTRARLPAGQLPDWLLRVLRPSGLFVFVDASPETVVRRKGELPLGKARLLQMQYRRMADVAQLSRINGDNAVDAVFRCLIERISAEYMRRTSEHA